MADNSTIQTPSQYRFSMSVAILVAQRVLPTPTTVTSLDSSSS